jgi:hypothetical protein
MQACRDAEAAGKLVEGAKSGTHKGFVRKLLTSQTRPKMQKMTQKGGVSVAQSWQCGLQQQKMRSW